MSEKKDKSSSTLQGCAIGNKTVDAKLSLGEYPHLKERVCALTNVGAGRKKNQDAASAYLYFKNKEPHIILTVADGLGAYAFSERSAYYAVTQIPLCLSEGKDLIDCFKECHQKIAEQLLKACTGTLQVEEGEQDMGCTTVVLADIKGDHACIANVGDSRAYLIRDSKIIYQTRDQSMIELLLSEGRLDDPLQARRHPLRNVILNSLGSPEPFYQFYERNQLVQKRSGLPILDEIELKEGDYLFLASDGAFTNLSDEELVKLITQTDWEELEDKISSTIQTVFKTGVTSLNEEANPDNYTFVVYRHLKG